MRRNFLLPAAVVFMAAFLFCFSSRSDADDLMSLKKKYKRIHAALERSRLETMLALPKIDDSTPPDVKAKILDMRSKINKRYAELLDIYVKMYLAESRGKSGGDASGTRNSTGTTGAEVPTSAGIFPTASELPRRADGRAWENAGEARDIPAKTINGLGKVKVELATYSPEGVDDLDGRDSLDVIVYTSTQATAAAMLKQWETMPNSTTLSLGDGALLLPASANGKPQVFMLLGNRLINVVAPTKAMAKAAANTILLKSRRR